MPSAIWLDDNINEPNLNKLPQKYKNDLIVYVDQDQCHQSN